MPQLKVGIISFINSLPFLGGLLLKEVKTDANLVIDTPSELNKKLLSGELDVSFISSVEYIEHSDLITPVTHFCIGAYKTVRSVKLFLKTSLADLDEK